MEVGPNIIRVCAVLCCLQRMCLSVSETPQVDNATYGIAIATNEQDQLSLEQLTIILNVKQNKISY